MTGYGVRDLNGIVVLGKSVGFTYLIVVSDDDYHQGLIVE